MKRDFCLRTSLFLFTALVPAAAFATTVVVPSTAQPGRAEQNMPPEPERPAVGGESIITVPDDNKNVKIDKNSATFTLKSITIENATAFTKEQLEADYKEFIGQKVSLRTLNQITARITAHYRNAGYILSRAVLPPQRITDGNVKIRIVEGFINKVSFEGIPVTSGLLNEYAEKIRTAKPLDAATLERYLLLIEDLPGVKAQAVLRPSASTPGASDVVITLSQKTFDGAATVDNRGSRYIGPFQGSLTVGANNLLGLYERTQLRGVTVMPVGEEAFGEISHEEQLDAEGTKLTVSAGRTHTNPGYKLKNFDVDGVDIAYSAAVSHPFIRSRQNNLYGTAQFDIRNTDTKSLGVYINGDRLRVARMGGSYDFVDSMLAVNKLETQLSKGFGWLDDTYPFVRSRVNGRTDFYKATAQASRLQPISGPFGLYIASTGQYASDALLSAEQFGLGGPTFGSAYDPSEITGDSGIAGRGELQFSQTNDTYLIPSYQLYGFYDIGEIWTRNPSAGTKKTQSLASAGLGTRFNILEPLSGSLELAIPMTKPVAADNTLGHGNAARVFFSLAYRY